MGMLIFHIVFRESEIHDLYKALYYLEEINKHSANSHS